MKIQVLMKLGNTFTSAFLLFFQMDFTASVALNSTDFESSKNLIFIDSNVSDYNSLTNIVSPQAKLFMLNSEEDGIEQISQILAQFKNEIASLHIISHGEIGNLTLGNSQLNADSLANYKDNLTGWDSALTNTADILLYGCNVAKNCDGENFVKHLSDLTGADIAASSDLTGNSALGGNWALEFQTGTIETNLPLQDTYSGVLHNNQLLDLAPTSKATHIAIKSGSWFDSTTWANGQVPGNGANVVISQGFQVIYDAQSDARLNTLRIDGTIQFAYDQNTKILVDTFVVLSTGKLLIGTQDHPIQADKTAQIVFTSNTPINKILDPKQLGRGLVSHGQTRIYGADKLDHVTLQGDALAGSNELVLGLPTGITSPQGWRVGDRIVLTGTDTNYGGTNANNSRYQDEVLTITQINGNRIRFTNNDITSGNNTVLRYNHQRPTGFENKELKIHVANLSRNIIFETENGLTVPINQRGHVMFMHNPDAQVHNASFYNLGRTDKSKIVDDPVENVDGSVGYGTNPRGRYALHLHHMGAENPNSTPSILEGNVVIGSPGWGIVHHASHANLEDNVVFDVAGAAIAAEAGNEIGVWRNNITIKTTGTADRDGLGQGSPRVKKFDFGFYGDGYWVQGAAQVAMENNIATSAANHGILIFGGGDGGPDGNATREVQTFAVANLLPEYQSIAKGTPDESLIDVSAVPLRKLTNFESYNSYGGISFWTTMQNEDGQLGFQIDGLDLNNQPAHRFFHVVKNVTLWGIQNRGLHFQYAGQVEVDGGLVLGDAKGTGILSNSNATHLRFKNLHVENFDLGMTVPSDYKDIVASRVENSRFAKIDQIFNTALIGDKKDKKEDFSDYFKIVNTTFDSNFPTNVKPVANFSLATAGGLAVNFDGSSSYDKDSSHPGSNKIVSYGWDFNNDGKIDKFGRKVSHLFSQAGSYQVNLTVWDEQGATNTLTRTVTVKSSPYPNLFLDGSFIQDSQFFTRPSVREQYSTLMADKGWVAGGWSVNNGVAVLSSVNQGIAQIIQDNNIRRGKQTLSLDLKNTEVDIKPNEIVVCVWGVNGEFMNLNWDSNGPQSVKELPMSRTKLLEQTVESSTFNWKNFKWNLDFNNGYQFVMLQVYTKGANPTKGDYVALDNVKLSF